MKAKTSAAFFTALLLLGMQFPLAAQTDCYSIQCPSKIFAPCEGVYGAHVYFSVTASNLCDPANPPTVTYSAASGSVFPPGTNTVCAIIQSGGVTVRQCCFDVIVDNCCPTNCIDLICPKDVVVPCNTAASPPGAYVLLPQPTPTNYCGDHQLPTGFQIRCNPPPQPGGVFFPPGTNTVVCCYADSANTLLKCCCFQVIVRDCPPIVNECQPRIACPPAAQIEVSCQSPSGAVVFFPPPNVSDPCHVVIATNCTHSSGSVFPNGKTTVAWCITYILNAANGTTATECCCFDVVVRCCPPTNCVSRLDCPTNIVIDCPPAGGIPLNYTVSGTNTCEPTSVICDPPSGSIIYGPTNVCCRLLNSSGITLAQCCFPVTVIDTTPPAIFCPTNITVNSPDCNPVHVPYPLASASDNCDPKPSVSCLPSPNDLFPCGTTTVRCTAVDSAGLSNSCTFTITVICHGTTDIVCSPDITARCASPTGAVVNYTISGTNGCTPTPFICSPPSGSVFPLGTTTVCCGFQGAPAPYCCFKVTVIPDDIPPRIVCPSNIVVFSDTCKPVTLDYPPPTATDDCQLDAVVCNPPSPFTFPIGITTVTCCARDTAGNKACCSFTVTVRCQTNCIHMVCPTNIVVDCAGPDGAVVTYTAYAFDDCNGAAVPVNCYPPSGSPFPIGITTVCCTNTVVGAAVPQVCCFDVIVRPDTVPPVITCPSNIVVFSENCKPVAVGYPFPTATDNCQLDSIVCNPPPTFSFPVGVTTVTCCARDKGGNTDCCHFTVTVRCPPDCIRLVCPTNILVDCAGPAGAVVTYTAYAIDTCTGATLPLTCSPPSGSTFPLGISTVCCSTGPSPTAPGAVCCFTVTVKPDLIPPTILCPSNIVVTSDVCQPVTLDYPLPSASDNCGDVSVVCNPPAPFAFPVGTTTVNCCATDNAGNSACCKFTVTVVCPNDCVRIVCPSNIVVECAGPTGAVVTYTAYAINDCTGAILPVSCAPPSGSNFPLGTTTVCCTNGSAAAGAISRCCFEVTVKPDTIPPVIICPSNIVVFNNKCEPLALDYPPVVATDNCALDAIICNPPAPFLFPIGVTTVTCCARDKAGNKACCSFTVTVRCPPDCSHLVCPSNRVVECAGPNGAVVTYNAYVVDDCNNTITPISCVPPSGSTFPPGITTVCCTNTTVPGTVPQRCCFDVIVRPDLIPPLVNCPSNIIILCSKPNGTHVTYKVSAVDNCDTAVTITCVPPSGSLFPIGCTNVVCRAVDSSGNVGRCSFRVCVVTSGCYVRNPSFEDLVSPVPSPLNCGDPIALAVGWSAVAGTPDLFRPPWASFSPGNCRGMERPCQGTNYAGLEGGYTASGGFVTEQMMGTLILPLNNGQQFRLRACLSLAESSPGPVLIEFVIANSLNLAQQVVIHQVFVTQTVGWQSYLPPCFTVPKLGNWDRLIIRAAKVATGQHPYQLGYVYVDNVNICCCKPDIIVVTNNPTTTTVVWDGAGKLEANSNLGDPNGWHMVDGMVEIDADGNYMMTIPRSPLNTFFRIVGPDDSTECLECGSSSL